MNEYMVKGQFKKEDKIRLEAFVNRDAVTYERYRR